MNSKHYNITTLWFLDDDDRMKMTIDLTEFVLKAMTHDTHRRRGRRAVMKNLKKRASSHEDRFPKTLFTLSQCRIAEDDGSKDLLSQLQMHIDERDEVALVVQQRRRRETRCVGDSWFLILWWPHIFIVKTYLGLQHLITYYVYLYQNVLDMNSLQNKRQKKAVDL
jgi:hypothetical protein